MMTTDAQAGERRTVTVCEAAKILGISKYSAYEAIKRSELPAIRLGHRLLVPKAALDKMLDAGEPAPEAA